VKDRQDISFLWSFKESIQTSPHEIVGFSFHTPNGAAYEGVFHPSPIWPPDSFLAGNTLDLVFGPKESNEESNHSYPVMKIVLSILDEYLSLLPHRCISYTCDDNDGRAIARQRLFVKTFDQNSSNNLELFHQPITIYGQALQFGLLYHNNHPKVGNIQSTLFTELRIAESK